MDDLRHSLPPTEPDTTTHPVYLDTGVDPDAALPYFTTAMGFDYGALVSLLHMPLVPEVPLDGIERLRKRLSR